MSSAKAWVHGQYAEKFEFSLSTGAKTLVMNNDNLAKAPVFDGEIIFTDAID